MSNWFAVLIIVVLALWCLYSLFLQTKTSIELEFEITTANDGKYTVTTNIRCKRKDRELILRFINMANSENREGPIIFHTGTAFQKGFQKFLGPISKKQSMFHMYEKK